MRTRDYLLMLGMLITGAINTISKKVQLQCLAPGITGLKNASHAVNHPFNKPWLQTLAMFMGEFLCMLGFIAIRFRKQRKQQVLMESGSEVPISSLTTNSLLSWVFFLPTLCDLLGTTVSGYSLMYIDASVWQMMRGSLIVFVGILSMIFLKRRLRLFNWTGISFTVVGLVLVGVSSVLKTPAINNSSTNSGSSGHKVLGVILILVGSLINSGQMVLEEALLKKRNFHPLQVVGSEGLIGSVVTGIILLPILYKIPGKDQGSFENVVDGLYQIYQNPLLLTNIILYCLSIAFYNYFGLSVARSLSAVHRTLIDALRTVLVWFVNLFLFYVVSKTYGESFSKSFGLLQIDGFAFLMIGTMIYNKVLNLDFIPLCRPNTGDITDSNVNATINDDTYDEIASQRRRPYIFDSDDEDNNDERSVIKETDPLLGGQ